jgi:cytidylate kinase
VIAVDGPAASGKGTLSRLIASHFHCAHLDTGLLYRAVAWEALQSNADLADGKALARVAAGLQLGNLPGHEQLRLEEVGQAASMVRGGLQAERLNDSKERCRYHCCCCSVCI